MNELDFAKKFILGYLPPSAQVPVVDIFNHLEQDPTRILHNALVYTNLKHFQDPDQKLAVTAINAFVAGFALAYCLRFPEAVSMLQAYLDSQSKARGENIVSLTSKRK